MRAELTLTLTNRQGSTLARRQARNAVMVSGAKLIAELFAGHGTPITHMGVGTSNEPNPESFSLEGLVNDVDGAGTPLGGPVEAPLAQDDFSVELLADQRLIKVTVRGTMPADAAVGTLAEAGLLSQTTNGFQLYNRVVFDPVEKGADHELTLFWEVHFPFGDLNWIA